MKKALTIVFIILFAYLYVMSSIYCYSFTSSVEKADAAIVLGAAVWNGVPSPVFEERIRHAIKLHQSKQVDKLIFTGGMGDGDYKSEAVVAMEYAIDKGVPKEKIIVESRSNFTFENLQFTSKLMIETNIDLVLVVSDPLHMKRSMMIAEDVGINALPSPTKTSRYIGVYARAKLLFSETYYYIGYQIRKVSNDIA